MPDDDRGRTHAASCATCRWWGVDDSGVGGECERARRRPVSLMGVWSVSQPGSECHAGFWTEPAFACAAWEPRRDSGPQGAPEPAQGSDVPVPGRPSRGGPFPASRAGVLYGQGGAG